MFLFATAVVVDTKKTPVGRGVLVICDIGTYGIMLIWDTWYQVSIVSWQEQGLGLDPIRQEANILWCRYCCWRGITNDNCQPCPHQAGHFVRAVNVGSFADAVSRTLLLIIEVYTAWKLFYQYNSVVIVVPLRTWYNIVPVFASQQCRHSFVHIAATGTATPHTIY